VKCLHCGLEALEPQQFCSNCGASCPVTESSQKTSGLSTLPLGAVLNGKYHIEDILKGDSVNVYRATSEGEQNSLLIQEASVNSKKKLNIITRVIGTLGHIKPWLSAAKKTEGKIAEVIVDHFLPLREKFELLSSLDSSDFQRAHEYFVLGDREYLVLENPPGQSLLDIVSEDLPSEYLAIDTAINLCQCVDRIHRAGYVHLDIEPGSIYWSDGRVRLFNFERAMRQGLQRHDFLTSDGYSAPELFLVDQKVDSRADIYSIGAVLFWMISGQSVPLIGASITKVLSSVSSFELARILISCLAHDPNSRFRNVEELKEKLMAYQLARKRDLHFDTACLTDTGMVRKNNEDSCFILESTQSTDLGADSYGVYLIADGMGGEQAGEVASTRAVAGISSFILDSLTALTKPDSFADLVKQPIEKANTELYHMARSSPQLSTMGTTVTLGLRVNNELYLGHVGDSRAYLIRGGMTRQLTQDHSVVAGLLKAGMITQEEARQHPDRGKIFRCLGSSLNVVIDTYKEIGNEEKLILQNGDSLVFCTDGLTAHVSDEEILAEVERPGDAYDACRQLISLANQRGGSDNISVIVAKSTDVK